VVDDVTLLTGHWKGLSCIKSLSGEEKSCASDVEASESSQQAIRDELVMLRKVKSEVKVEVEK